MAQMMDLELDRDMMMNAYNMAMASGNFGTGLNTDNVGQPFSTVDQQSLQHQQQQQQQPQQQQFDPNTSDIEISGNDIMAAVDGGAGAGPLPQGFGTAFSNGSNTFNSSTLTEFTKRRNWSQRVLEELRDFLHILTSDGRFLYVSPSCKALTGWEQSQLVGKFIGDFLHHDDNGFFVREFNESIATGNPLRFFYRFKKADETFTIFEAHGHPHLSSEAAGYTSQSTTNFCRGFFIMSRPYPTKNTELLDRFLEHKTENERLLKRIAALKEEEQQDDAASRVSTLRRNGTADSGSTSPAYFQNGNETPGNMLGQSPAYGSMPPPAVPKASDTALTAQNLKEANAGSKPDSINDKMARYAGTNFIEGIEMMTGLHYREGERSKGISTGDVSPALIRGDAGIAISMDSESRMNSEKKKKLKPVDEYVCTDCGTLDSPEWRKGPQGAKTLCNACGCEFVAFGNHKYLTDVLFLVRWAKKEKKRQSVGDVNTPGGTSTPVA